MPYGIIENGQCVNAIEADETFALSLGAVGIPEGYWIGDYYDGEWHHQKPETMENRVKILTKTPDGELAETPFDYNVEEED